VKERLANTKNWLFRRHQDPSHPMSSTYNSLGSPHELDSVSIGLPVFKDRNFDNNYRTHVESMRQLRDRPDVHLKSLIKRMALNWGLKEEGAEHAAHRLTQNSEITNATIDALTHSKVSSAVADFAYNDIGVVFGRTPLPTSVKVMHDHPEIANQLYSVLANDRRVDFSAILNRGREIDEEAAQRRADKEAAERQAAEMRALEQARMFVDASEQQEQGRPGPEHPDVVYAPVNGKNGAGLQPISIVVKPVFNNNNGDGNMIGSRQYLSKKNGYQQYDGKIVDDVPVYVDVAPVAGKQADKPERKGVAKVGFANKVDRYRRFSVFKSKMRGRQGTLSKWYVPSEEKTAQIRKLVSGPQVGAFQVSAASLMLKDGEKPLALSPGAAAKVLLPVKVNPLALPQGQYSVAVRKLLSEFRVSKANVGMHEENIFKMVNGKNLSEAKTAVVGYLSTFSRKSGKLRYVDSKYNSKNSKLVALVETVHRAANQ